MEQIFLDINNQDLVLKKLNEITKGSYFTIEKGYSDEDIDPFGKEAEKIKWGSTKKETFKDITATKGNNPSFDIVVLSRRPSHSSRCFIKGTKVYFAKDQLVFRGPEEDARAVLMGLRKFLYTRIYKEQDDPETKYAECLNLYNHENETIYKIFGDDDFGFGEDEEEVEAEA